MPAFLPDPDSRPGADSSLLESYRRLAEVFHHVLSEQSRDLVLDRVADTLAELVPYHSLIIYEAEEARRELVPVLARDRYAEEILQTRCYFGEGISGWAVENRRPVLANRAHLDPRVKTIPGTPPDEPEALITIPLIARSRIKGALNIYRLGDDAFFSEHDFELARWFGDAAALAMDNAEIRARLELQAQTDSLTGLYNHRFFQERLRSELARASRARDNVALVMFDIDDFKRINDICGHGVGDEILVEVAELTSSLVRGSDVVCRLGGEEFAVIMPSCDSSDGVGLARRLMERLASHPIDASEPVTLSIGVAHGPEHAMNPRELLACAEAAMMTAKARGKRRIVVFNDETTVRPDAGRGAYDARSISHLKMLQSLAGRLSRLNGVKEIAEAVVGELRTMVDYHSCRVYLAEGDELVPVGHLGDIVTFDDRRIEPPTVRIGEGITGHVAETGRSLLVRDANECEHTKQIPGTPPVDESLIAVPMRYGSRTTGVIFLSKLGFEQFDEDDLRLLEVLAGHASVAFENARLYEAVRREADNANVWLEFADAMSAAGSLEEIADETVRTVSRLLDVDECSLWLEEESSGEFRCAAEVGYKGEAPTRRALSGASARLIESRGVPFTMTAEECRETFWGGAHELELHAMAIAPLRPGYGVRGWITLRRSDDDLEHFTDDRLRLLEGLSYRTSMALQKALLFRDQQQAAAVSNAMLEFARGIASAHEEAEVLARIPELTARLLHAPAVFVWLQDADPALLRLDAAWPPDGSRSYGGIGSVFGFELARPILERGVPCVVTPEDREAYGRDASDGLCYAVAPLHLPGGRLGSIVVAAASAEEGFSELRLRVLGGLADQARVALSAAR